MHAVVAAFRIYAQCDEDAAKTICWRPCINKPWKQGISLASAIVPDVREFAVQFGQFLSETIFGNARCAVMNCDAIVFLL